MKRLALAFLLAAPAYGQDVRPYRPGIDVLDYALTLDLPDSGSFIKGDAVLTVRRLARVGTLSLDFPGLRVRRVTVDDRTTQFVRADSTLQIALPRGDSGRFRVRVTYEGNVADGLIVRQDSLKRWTYFGDNWPNRARHWIPSVDHPSDKATVSWTVSAPAGRTVVANGVLVDSRTTGRGRRARTTWRWRESRPIPTYLMVIGAAPLARIDLGDTACGLGDGDARRCVRQSVYVAPELRGTMPGNFAKAGDIVRYFATLVGPFPYEKLAHVQSATRFGGMENATAIFYSDAAFRRPEGVGEGLIAHETAHQWFGDAVTEREWPHLWLSEGFATYFAALWTQKSRGDSAFIAEMARIRQRVLSDTAAVPKKPVIDTITTELIDLLNRNSYEKGGFVLHMLRRFVGDKEFFGGLRSYYAKYRNGTVLTPNLQAEIEASSGKKLGPFFDQWLRRAGYPEMDVVWSDSALTSLSVSITQSGRFGLFEFPLQLALIGPDGDVRRVEIGVPAQLVTRVVLPVTGSVERIEADPDVQLLARITVQKP
ncbi:MAG TPA: M1 family metallopeptidase [Gemmatimonadaceae bacterium]|nr:M1 family metallopeptidase [Gemmatimonadaceae bacterium]